MKTNSQFIIDRLKRLGIPFLFFTFLVFLPFNYLGDSSGKNVFEIFIDTYFNKPPMASGHLWFVASLFVYSLLYILLFRPRSQTVMAKAFHVYYAVIYI